MTALTKLELQSLHSLVTAHLPPGRPLSVEEVVRAGEMRDRLTAAIDGVRAREETGDLVLEWRIPREWTAPKSGKGLPRWALGQMMNKLGDDLRRLLPSWPRADLHCAHRRRWVQVRRFSDKKPDRPHCPDCLGARQAVDALTAAGVIVDDSPVWTVDDADWIRCKRGQTHVVIRVFEISSEGKHWPEPDCLPPPRPVKKRGPIVQSIVDTARSTSVGKTATVKMSGLVSGGRR